MLHQSGNIEVDSLDRAALEVQERRKLLRITPSLAECRDTTEGSNTNQLRVASEVSSCGSSIRRDRREVAYGYRTTGYSSVEVLHAVVRDVLQTVESQQID